MTGPRGDGRRGVVRCLASSTTVLLGFLLVTVPCGSYAQITWGPGSLHISDTNDLSNQQRLHELLQRAYFTGVTAEKPQHELMPAIVSEIASFRARVEEKPALALAVAMAKYHFAWYKEDSADMDVESVEDAANLMYMSIRFSGCSQPDLPADVFFQRMCSARWPYAVLMYSELGREFASRYLTDQAADILEKAVAAFDEMKRLPYYSPLVHWDGPYDINFNEEWFPGVQPAGPVWDKASVPLAQVLETHFDVMAAELGNVVDAGLFDQLHFEGIRAEGQDHAPDEGWRSVELSAIDPQAPERWGTRACQAAPRTCELLASRPEMQGCRHSYASWVRLRAGGRLKPQYGAAPQLTCHVVLKADPGARMSVGNRTIAWKTRDVIVFDGSYIRQEWHAGVKGDRYVLNVVFCHPCDDSQRSLYGAAVACPAQAAQGVATAPQLTPAAQSVPVSPLAQTPQAFISAPFAAAALWAATLPELALCNGGISETCQPDTQHGGPNPLSAMNTWNYAFNNLKAALRHAGTAVDPALQSAIDQVQAGIQNFFSHPALDHFNALVTSAVQIFQAVAPWLREQPPARVHLGVLPPTSAAHNDHLAAGLGLGRTALTLPTGSKMPVVGFGTWKLEGTSCYEAVRWALESGVRHIDTGEAYANEAEVGRALRDSGVPREEVFLAVKATSVAMGMAEASYLEAIFVNQLQSLQTDYVDVYLLHAAGVKGEQLRAVWQGMERLYELGRAKALGVSNFGVDELEELWTLARVKPAYLQNIYKVYKPGEQILDKSSPDGSVQWAQRHGMVVVGYSVINSWPHLMPPLQDPHVLAIAQAHGRTSSQVLHRWALQHGIAVIPKASSLGRVRENTMVLDFELTPIEMAALDGLATLSESTNSELRPGWSPDLYGLHRQPATAAAVPQQNAFAPASVSQPVAPTAASHTASFEVAAQGRQCNRNLPEVKAEMFSLGGGGHQLSSCEAACSAQADCRYITYYHSTGFCHMYRNCLSPEDTGDNAVIYVRASMAT